MTRLLLGSCISEPGLDHSHLLMLRACFIPFLGGALRFRFVHWYRDRVVQNYGSSARCCKLLHRWSVCQDCGHLERGAIAAVQYKSEIQSGGYATLGKSFVAFREWVIVK